MWHGLGKTHLPLRKIGSWDEIPTRRRGGRWGCGCPCGRVPLPAPSVRHESASLCVKGELRLRQFQSSLSLSGLVLKQMRSPGSSSGTSSKTRKLKQRACMRRKTQRWIACELVSRSEFLAGMENFLDSLSAEEECIHRSGQAEGLYQL